MRIHAHAIVLVHSRATAARARRQGRARPAADASAHLRGGTQNRWARRARDAAQPTHNAPLAEGIKKMKIQMFLTRVDQLFWLRQNDNTRCLVHVASWRLHN